MDIIDFDYDTWNVVNNYFETNKKLFDTNHLDSFNNFIFEKYANIFSI